MKLDGFKLEVYMCEHEFSAPYLMCCSDCEAMTTRELLSFEPGAEEAFLDSWLGYTESLGDPQVLEGICKLYETVAPAHVLEHVGAQEAIFNFLNAVLEPGDHVISMFPNYESSYSVAKKIGCTVSNWELNQTENGWAISIPRLEKLIKPNTKVIMLCTPNNPTGYFFSKEEIHAISEIARRQEIIIFADEVYKGLHFAGEEPPAFVDVYENAVSLNVLSKAFGLAGIRIGWIATKNKKIHEAMAMYKHYTTICSPKPSQFLAVIALKHHEKILDRNRGIVKENLALADTFFEKRKDMFLYNPPMGGSIGFHKLRGDRDINKFSKDQVEKSGVLLLPGYVFDYPGNYFRIGYGRKNFPEVLERFGEKLHK